MSTRTYLLDGLSNQRDSLFVGRVTHCDVVCACRWWVLCLGPTGQRWTTDRTKNTCIQSHLFTVDIHRCGGRFYRLPLTQLTGHKLGCHTCCLFIVLHHKFPRRVQLRETVCWGGVTHWGDFVGCTSWIFPRCHAWIRGRWDWVVYDLRRWCEWSTAVVSVWMWRPLIGHQWHCGIRNRWRWNIPPVNGCV